jgi:hypothetical protein
MTITFRVDDGFDKSAIPPAIITSDQLGSLHERLARERAKTGAVMVFPEDGEPGNGAFALEARICPMALAAVSACFDHDTGILRILEEAQFRGRRVRVWQQTKPVDIWIGVASSPDNAPELNVSNNNAFALLEMLGLMGESTGVIAMTQLRQRLIDPRIRRRLDDEPGLARYLPTLIRMAALKPIEGELHMAWA